MNHRETFEFIESIEIKTELYKETVRLLEQDVVNASLKLLKEYHGLEVGGQYYYNNKVFKLTKIRPEHYKNHISYMMIGSPTKKNKEFSKKEQLINFFLINKEGTI